MDRTARQAALRWRPDLSISSQRRAEITVGIAQGTSMTARIAPRPRNLELTIIAMNRPMSNSSATEMTVKMTVVIIASMKSSSKPLIAAD